MNVKLSRRVLLVLCGLLFVVFVSPASSNGGNLVVNGDFSVREPGNPSLDDIPGWDEEIGNAVLSTTRCHTLTDAYSLTTKNPQTDLALHQCVTTSGLASVDVGGWVWLVPADLGMIDVILYKSAGCGDSNIGPGGGPIVLTDEDPPSTWARLEDSYVLPESIDGTSSVKIILRTTNGCSDDQAYFDDISVQEYDPTGVLLVEPVARAGVPVALVPALAIALVVLGLVRVLGRRRR